MIKSKALEINLLNHHIDIIIPDRYNCIKEVLSQYPGLIESLGVVLKEVEHPYKNWGYIIKEMTKYALDYFYLFKRHKKGGLASETIVKIFIEAIESNVNDKIKLDSIENLMRYLMSIATESNDNFFRFILVINRVFDWMLNVENKNFYFISKSFYTIKKLIKLLIYSGNEIYLNYYLLNSVLIRYLRTIYSYWRLNKDPLIWLNENIDIKSDRDYIKKFFIKISHDYIVNSNNKVLSIHYGDVNYHKTKKKYLKKNLILPDQSYFVKNYESISNLIISNIGSLNANKWKVLFLFHSIGIIGLSSIHEKVLKNIEQTISLLISNENYIYIKELVNKTFFILEDSVKFFPEATFSCISTMGYGIYKTKKLDLIELFVDKVVNSYFHLPKNFDDYNNPNDWKIKNNIAHIRNIRAWIDLICLKPKWSKKIISTLIINLSIGGLFIKDTDLFPRDITYFLNSKIAPVYNLVKQLTRLFPAYFTDIGAEGSLREVSTKLDEITLRKDILIHYLRKQTHVESSNRIISFIEAVIKFWETKNKDPLKEFVPQCIFSEIESSGIHIDGVNRLLNFLKASGFNLPYDLLLGVDEKISEIVGTINGVNYIDFERFALMGAFYKLLHDKYNLGFRALRNSIDQLREENFPNLGLLTEALKKKKLKNRIFYLLKFLDRLKIIILSDDTYKMKTEIYKKRHFAFNIPSTYGSYYELKFAALGLSFRVESLVNVLFEELNKNLSLEIITKGTFFKIYEKLKLFDRALKIDGIYSVEFEKQMFFLSRSLDMNEFTYTQYIDVFKGFIESVNNIMNDYFHNVHGQNLTDFLIKLNDIYILPKYLSMIKIHEDDSRSHRISEIFFRDRIAMSLGLQQLDFFLSKIYTAIVDQSNKLDREDLQLLLNYDTNKVVSFFGGLNDGNSTEFLYMGSKGVNMKKLYNLGLPTPPCFIITTEAFRNRNLINHFCPVKKNFINKIKFYIKKLEKLTGKILGDYFNPMLLSIRSGSSVSQPGMMETLVNVGLNQKIVEGMGRKKKNYWFAWDSYRRFLGCFGISFGLNRNCFDDIINEFKDLFGVSHKKEFSVEHMKTVALAYKSRIEQEGIHIPNDPYDQLYTAINVVFNSWKSKKAKTYRSIIGISEDWGTAVVIQDMVFGNLSKSSGSGVFFTHNPRCSGDELNLCGDFTIGGQGEDVVSGLVKTFPISLNQQKIEFKDTYITLETHFPGIYNTIKKWANILVYKRGWGPQEVEFTFESPSSQDLYILQTRDMSVRERSNSFNFNEINPNKSEHIATGIGVSGGVINGRVVFDNEDIKNWRRKEPNCSLILLRRDTVPDDIKEIFMTNGLLTVKGGVTSHASVVAHRLGKTCVVGCGNFVCKEREKIAIFDNIIVKTGDFISIDGYDGSIFLGERYIK